MLAHWLTMKTITLGILGISSSLFKCNYLKNGERFLNFLFHLWNFHQIWNIFEKNMMVIANEFPQLQIGKGLVKPMSWKRHFRTSFDSQHVNGCQTLVKSAWELSYHIFRSLWREMTGKISPLLNFEILGMFFKTFFTNDKYPFLVWENLKFPIQL